MAALLSLQGYDSDSTDSKSEEEKSDGFNDHFQPIDKSKSVAASIILAAAPEVESIVRLFHFYF